jgi:glycosyltransferase involved in cell wall biosynthesis
MRLEAGADKPAARELAKQMEAQERRIWRLVDLVLYPSEEEAEQVRALEPTVRARAIPAYALPRPEAPRVVPCGGVIFVGGFRHPPNTDAAVWLAQEIMPILRQRVPAVSLTIIGSHPTPAIVALSGEGVEVRGFVSDEELAAAYAQARIAVCPLRVGAGVKLKVVEAMHRGVPVVTTSVGAQGLPGLNDICDVVDTADGLAEAAARLMTNDAVWLKRAQEQTSYVADHFSHEKLQASLLAAFEDLTLDLDR